METLTEGLFDYVYFINQWSLGDLLSNAASDDDSTILR